jgi:shikimate dehydrogenase
MNRPSGSTRLAAVIGSPIRHSLSPAIMNAAFEAAEVDWVFVALEVESGHLPDALVGMRTLDIAGLSVTTPHKESAAACVDHLSTDAEHLGAVNCIVNDGGVLTGHNTDGDGFVRSLSAEHSFVPAGRRCVVLGAGGAARSIVLALGRAEAAEVAVVNRTRSRAETAASLAGSTGRVVEPADVAAAVDEADLVVNATSIGMGGTTSAALPLDPASLREGQLVVDIVYRPLVTPLLAAAHDHGALVGNGVGMLTHQAARQFELWTGLDAPIDAMTAAVADWLR